MIEKEYQEQLDFIVRRIREEREKSRISQIELSFAAGLSQNQINCIETGRSVPNLYTLLKICNALKIKPECLFSEPNEERERDAEQIISLVKKYLS